MTSVRIKAVVVALLMMLAFFGSIAWRPHIHLSNSRPKIELEALFPKSFGDWVVDDRIPVQLISPDTQAVLDKIYNQTLSRTYVNQSGERIMLSVAYGGDQSDGTRAHRPDVCYPAQGFQIISAKNAQMALGTHLLPVRQIVAKQGLRTEPVTYWVTVGDRVTVSGTEQKLAQLSYTTRGVIPDGMLVRISNIDNDPAKSYLLHQRFTQAMVHAIAPQSLSRVVGMAVAS